MTGDTVSLFFLFCLFFYIGLITIGGGLVGLTIMQQLLVDRFHLITPEFFYSMVAVSESTPGPIGVNMATYIGTELYGPGGGIITTLGQVLPSIICILIIARFFGKFSDRAGVKAAFSTLRPAVTGVIAVAAAKIFVIALLTLPSGGISALDSLKNTQVWLGLFNFQNIFFYVLACIILFKTKIHPLFVVMMGGFYGVLFL